MSARDLPDASGYSRVAVAGNAIVAIIVTALAVWWAAGQAVFYENLFRISPVAQGPTRGVGHDWVVGNTNSALNTLITLTHLADVVLGIFILLLVFIHWGAFRRLAGRMQQPGEAGGAVTDGGEPADGTGGDRP